MRHNEYEVHVIIVTKEMCTYYERQVHVQGKKSAVLVPSAGQAVEFKLLFVALQRALSDPGINLPWSIGVRPSSVSVTLSLGSN